LRGSTPVALAVKDADVLEQYGRRLYGLRDVHGAGRMTERVVTCYSSSSQRFRARAEGVKEFGAGSMLVYESQIVINAGAHRVWQVLSDVARWPQWLPTVTRVVPLDGEAIVVGGTLPGGAAEAEAGGVDGD